MVNKITSLVGIVVRSLLYACADVTGGGEDDPKAELKSAMVGIWKYNGCYLDGDSGVFRQGEVVTFNDDDTYQLDITLYEPNDTTCSGRPIARTIERGSFILQGAVTSTNNNLPAYEIDFHADPEETVGNTVLGQPTLDPVVDATILYSIVYVDVIGKILYLGDNYPRTDIAADRTTNLSWQHSKVDNLPANYNDFLPVPDYTPPTLNDLNGTWVGRCFHDYDEPHLHKVWSYIFNGPSVTIFETIYDGDVCTAANRRGYITYTATVSIGSVTTTNSTPAAATAVDMNITAVTPTDNIAYLTNYPIGRTLTETMLIDSTYGVLLESSGTGSNNSDRPTFLDPIYQRTN